MRAFVATVMALVFADELACMAAFSVWGWHVGGPVRGLVAVVAPLVGMTAWFFLASPKARFGDPVVRPVAKAVVFALGSLGLWRAGQAGLAIALLVGSVVVNGVAHLPVVQRTARDTGLLPAP